MSKFISASSLNPDNATLDHFAARLECGGKNKTEWIRKSAVKHFGGYPKPNCQIRNWDYVKHLDSLAAGSYRRQRHFMARSSTKRALYLRLYLYICICVCWLTNQPSHCVSTVWQVRAYLLDHSEVCRRDHLHLARSSAILLPPIWLATYLTENLSRITFRSTKQQISLRACRKSCTLSETNPKNYPTSFQHDHS